MTEYDYSPEAYERYMQTQQRIAQWVNQTEEHRPQFDADGEPRSRPSLLQRLTHRRQSHSMHDPRHRQDSTSSSSSSSSVPYASSPQAPGPMPMPTYQTMYLPQTAPPTSTYYQSKHINHPKHSSHHRSSHRSPKYVMTPPTSPPAQGYPYSYDTSTSSRQVISPGPYAYPAKADASTVGSPLYYQPTSQGYYPQTSYPFPQTYAQTQLPQPPQTAPATTYGFYGQGQAPPLASPPAQYPQTAAYPPTIFPLTPYGTQQQIPQKPVFYQRIFGRNKKGNHSRRSY